MVHVLDTAACLNLQSHTRSLELDEQELLETLFEMIVEGELTFPKEVADEVKQRGRGQPVAQWMNVVHGARPLKGVSWEHAQHVSVACGGLVDPDSTDESPVYVAGYAHYFQQAGVPIHVVSDDSIDKPTRISLASACQALGFHCEPMEDFLQCVGIA